MSEFEDSGFVVIREPSYSPWPFAPLDEHQNQARRALEIRIRTSRPKIPTVFGELDDPC